jgi:polyhydroxyalkanoate synthesis regulator phasin
MEPESDAQATDSSSTENGRSPLQELLLAGLGWMTLGAEAVDELADELSRRVTIERDEMRDAVRDVVGSWRAEARRLGARQDELTDQTLKRLGLARREEVDDLHLRVAQLEHRLRLLERSGA